jgi:carboxymethylenebutenolidase
MTDDWIYKGGWAVSGKMIEFESKGGKTQGYLSRSEAGAGVGVIVLQEWWGLNAHIKDVAARFAREGFTALAPDLYHGDSTTQPDDAGRLMMALDIGRTAKDLTGAVRYLLALESTTGDRVGCIGFCMGGQLALYAATENPAIGACVDFYGIHPKVEPNLQKLEGAFLGHFAEMDEFVPPQKGKALVEKLRSLRKTAEIEIYEGCDHAFFNDTRPEVYNVDAAERAWKRTIGFLREHLEGPSRS